MSEYAIDACGTCGEPFVSHGYTQTTLVGFMSPPGHDHDGNCLGRDYKCRHGHRTTLSLRRRCHACDWTGRDECFCHPGKKVDRWPAGDVLALREL